MFEKVTLKYVPNYKINLIDPRKLEDLKCFKTDLQMVFGMLKYKNSKVKMKEFVNKNKAFFSQLDEDTYNAAKVMLGSERSLKAINELNDNVAGGIDMCKALEDLYQDGVKEGISQGISQGIEAFVLDYQEEGFCREKIISKLMKRFSLSDEEAKAYYEQFAEVA